MEGIGKIELNSVLNTKKKTVKINRFYRRVEDGARTHDLRNHNPTL